MKLKHALILVLIILLLCAFNTASASNEKGFSPITYVLEKVKSLSITMIAPLTDLIPTDNPIFEPIQNVFTNGIKLISRLSSSFFPKTQVTQSQNETVAAEVTAAPTINPIETKDTSANNYPAPTETPVKPVAIVTESLAPTDIEITSVSPIATQEQTTEQHEDYRASLPVLQITQNADDQNTAVSSETSDRTDLPVIEITPTNFDLVEIEIIPLLTLEAF